MKDSKPKGRAPAFQFYADDFLAGTMTMTNEERGAYISLLCLQWSKGFVTELDIQRSFRLTQRAGIGTSA